MVVRSCLLIQHVRRVAVCPRRAGHRLQSVPGISGIRARPRRSQRLTEDHLIPKPCRSVTLLHSIRPAAGSIRAQLRPSPKPFSKSRMSRSDPFAFCRSFPQRADFRRTAFKLPFTLPRLSSSADWTQTPTDFREAETASPNTTAPPQLCCTCNKTGAKKAQRSRRRQAVCVGLPWIQQGNPPPHKNGLHQRLQQDQVRSRKRPGFPVQEVTKQIEDPCHQSQKDPSVEPRLQLSLHPRH